jgi:ABC-type nitrate/sulfonate/bicarbonate transport system substrate-binding protein
MANQKNTSSMFKIGVVIAVILTGVATFFILHKPKVDDKSALQVVKFGMLAYGDHTQAIIGVKNGWFKDVGIDLKYEVINIDAVVPSLNTKRFDVVSTPPGVLLSAYDNASDLCSFVLADVFQGYAIMAQPGSNYKTYDDFIKSGLSNQDAIKATVQQLKGKTFAYPSETAIKPFIDILLQKAEMTRKDFKSLVQDDPVNVNSMRAKQADFQVGGVPSRITLQKEGFIPLISSIDIVKSAQPSPDSKELASVFQDGWAVRKDYYESNMPTILRLASVNFRITQYMNDHQDSALAIHMPYLTQVTGSKYTVEDGKIIYNYLDPFYTFQNQHDWFHNSQSPLYYKNLYGSIINSFKDQGLYKGKVPHVDDIIYADDVYLKLEQLKTKTEENLTAISSKNLATTGDLKTQLEKAKNFYSIYDYFDSEKITTELLKN